MIMLDIETTSEEDLRQAIDRFWETFPPVWNSIRGHIRIAATEQFDITVEQFHIMRHIRKGKLSVGELADIQQISRPGISQALDVLVDRGLVTRRQNVDDRRVVQLELTQSGCDLMAAISNNNRSWMMKKMALLSPDEITRLLHSLELLKKTFDETPD
jgi:DNA-binding MarR family transcriptional regulator